MSRAAHHTPAMQAQAKPGAKEKFLQFLERKNLRLTTQRQAIIDTVFGT